MGIRRVCFWPASVTTLASILSFQKLIDNGIINKSGVPLSDQIIQLSETMPPIKPENLAWAGFPDVPTIEAIFQLLVQAEEASRMTEWFICNSTTELESAAFSLYPQLLPIGPLLASNRLADQTGHFWPEDSTCLTWLDQLAPCSVIYIAFGSFTIFNQTQFEELAFGLELSNRPFLWVVRPGITKETTVAYPDGFIERVSSRGRIVSWAPQQKVLAHPSVACFTSHCGWNSTLEGVTNGLPFLCWPYFADQFHNETYICDIWKTGLGFNKNDAGIPLKDQMIQLSPTMPRIRTTSLPWAFVGDLETTKSVFKISVDVAEAATMTEWVYVTQLLSLSLQHSACTHNCCPLGFASKQPTWLTRQATSGKKTPSAWHGLINNHHHRFSYNTKNSGFVDSQFLIVYSHQSVKLNISLKTRKQSLQKQQALCILRHDIPRKRRYGSCTSYTLSAQGHVMPMMELAQRFRHARWYRTMEKQESMTLQKVLAHPSVACFLSHCGWNSTLEGVTNGLPFLCWPYISDQFNNQTYICDIWKTGLGFAKDQSGIITREEIKNKLERLLSDKTFKAKAMDLKQKATSNVEKGGNSHNNLSIFIDWIQDKDTNT
ncbi:UDP-glucuronosyl/UDP-glucosyltransferase [Artemisia annua]|uniref:UDP-glucuronosyl/UDP-glucosyltransferase n=1 Tax=Artemisia annua TaxID=35608 RepID=A0A2U1NIK4_ARTAN|nr:UDP-glucuronosyl/UDP-glucosyltransferase [Artemisia annua]